MIVVYTALAASPQRADWSHDDHAPPDFQLLHFIKRQPKLPQWFPHITFPHKQLVQLPWGCQGVRNRMRGWLVGVSSYTEVVPLQKALENILMSNWKFLKISWRLMGPMHLYYSSKMRQEKLSKQWARNQHFVNNLPFVIHQHNFVPQLSPLINVCAFFVLFFLENIT